MTKKIYIPRLTDNNTGLAPMDNDDFELFFYWFNSDHIAIPMGDIDQYPFTREDAKRYTQKHLKDTWLVVIKDKGLWTPIGYAGIFIRQRHRIGILRVAIGEEKYENLGHGSRACKLILRWCFDYCNLHAIHVCVSASNVKAIDMYRNLGFRECGKYTESRYEKGERHDEVLMELTITTHAARSFTNGSK